MRIIEGINLVEVIIETIIENIIAKQILIEIYKMYIFQEACKRTIGMSIENI